jgi:hypothetical protein
MANDVDQRKVVKGRGTKRRWHEAKFIKGLENPTIIIDVGWQNLH